MEESKEKTDVGKKGTNRRSSSENTGYDHQIWRDKDVVCEWKGKGREVNSVLCEGNQEEEKEMKEDTAKETAVKSPEISIGIWISSA